MGTRDPDDLLTVAEVMARYRLRDRRAARRIIDAAGGFRMGAGLFVRVSDLRELEDRHRHARAATEDPHVAPATPLGSRDPCRRQPLERGWWRRDDSEAA